MKQTNKQTSNEARVLPIFYSEIKTIRGFRLEYHTNRPIQTFEMFLKKNVVWHVSQHVT